MSARDFTEIVRKLRRLGRDNDFVEAKKCQAGLQKDVWESVSAFANTKGGILILGLDEVENFSVTPNFQVNTVEDQFVSGMGDGGDKGRLTNPPKYNIETIEFEGGLLLVIEIEELDYSCKPCFLTERGKIGGSYKRVDDKDIRMSANEVYSLEMASMNAESDREAVAMASAMDLDKGLCEQSFALAQKIMPRALRGVDDYETKLKRVNYLNADGTVTKAGLLVAGLYPQQFFPKLQIDVAVHPGRTKGEGGSVRFLDRQICAGTIGEMIEEAVSAIARNLKRKSIIAGIGRIDELEIPEEVLREALVNALLHREYDARFTGEAVSVDIYDDRIEITNPGGLWGGKSEKNLLDGRSCCRNATLLNLLRITTLPGNGGSPAEGNGTGLNLMVTEMKNRGLCEPVFAPSLSHFKVILMREAVQGVMDVSGRSDDEKIVINYLRSNGVTSMKKLSENTGLKIGQTRSLVNRLIDADIIEATAPLTSRNRKYRIKQAKA